MIQLCKKLLALCSVTPACKWRVDSHFSIPVQRHWPHFILSLLVRSLAFLLLGYLAVQYGFSSFYLFMAGALLIELGYWLTLQIRLNKLSIFGFDGQPYLVSAELGRLDCCVVGPVRVTHFLVALVLVDTHGKRSKWPLVFSPCNCGPSDFHRLRQFLVLNAQYS